MAQSNVWERISMEPDHLDVGEPTEEAIRAGIYPKKQKVIKRYDPCDLPNVSTRMLLVYLHSYQVSGDIYASPYANSALPITIDQLKAELATREHVPNKPEAKALRRARALGRVK